ncbi:hypothetical protein AYI69_g7723 [Smittium culicis]|uniref:Uncharacterized protein n=1 Tax=Smittium culicis TaxID=133412 RepID=A0A1R1XPZ8_9FUNG|nr:hypothetical protein AYI69_g7723 [Smittium culicis]
MSEETNAKIQALSDKFDRLMQLMPVEEPEDRFVVTRPPTTDLSVYPELVNALPSIEQDFFCTPLTEDELKDAIYSCPRSSSMNYQPPLLNDSSSAAVKKADTNLNGTQNSTFSKPATAQNNEAEITPAATNSHLQTSNFRGRGHGRGRGSHLEKTHRQQGPEPEIQGVQGGIERLERFGKEVAAQISADGTAAINITPATQQTKDQPRGPPDTDRGSRFALIKKALSRKFIRRLQVQSTVIRTVTKSAYFLQNPPPDISMGENTGNPDFSILGRSADSRELEETMFDEHRHSVFQANRSGNADKLARIDPQGPYFQYQGPQTRGHKNHESWDGDFEMSGEFHWKGTGHVYSPDAGTINVEKALRAEERLPRQDEIMDIECYSDGTINPESTILDQPAEIMEWFALPTREPRTGDIYRCQRHGMGDRCGLPILLGIVESLGGVDSHQRQGIINNIICTPAPECCRTLGISLLRQYHDISLRQEVWWNDFSRVSEDRGKHMEPLPGIKYPASSHIRAINFEPCGRAEQTDRSDRMVFIGPSIRESHNPIWGTRYRPVCIEGEQAGGSLLQLVSRQEIRGTERSRLQLDSLVQPLLLPALESNRPSSPECKTGAAEDHSDHPSLENRDMVPGPFAIVNRSTTPATSNICGSGSKKRKFFALQQ